MAFSKKVVLITGASSGIGAPAAEAFAGLSAQLVLVGRNEANLKRVAAACDKFPGARAHAVIADVSKDADAERIVRETIETFGRLDVLVNNAGFGIFSRFEDGIAPYDSIMATNMRGVYLLTSLAAPHLAETRGNVVNVSSIGALRPVLGFMSYCISKAALDMFTKCAALELSQRGVRVNSVNPGATKTHFLTAVGMSGEESTRKFEQVAETTPLKRVAEGKDIADMIVYLAGEQARSITGTIVTVDNGTMLQSSMLIDDK